MQGTTVLEVAEAFIQHVFCWCGSPLSLCSDRGPPLHSAVMHEIFSILGFMLKFSTPHTLHSHGDIECQHCIINELQRILFQGQFPNILARWDEYAKFLQVMLNTAVVERHGMSPLLFFFGRQPRLPASPAQSPDALYSTSLEFVLSFQTRFQEALDVGRLAQSHLIENMDKRLDLGYALAVGDWAMWMLRSLPYLVIHISGLNTRASLCQSGHYLYAGSTATLEIPEHWQISTNTFNVDKLKQYVARDGAPLPPCPRRFANRVAANQGTVSRVTHHRRVGQMGRPPSVTNIAGEGKGGGGILEGVCRAPLLSACISTNLGFDHSGQRNREIFSYNVDFIRSDGMQGLHKVDVIPSHSSTPRILIRWPHAASPPFHRLPCNPAPFSIRVGVCLAACIRHCR
jgi:hypothetical protein